jgi:hypothetical protein
MAIIIRKPYEPQDDEYDPDFDPLIEGIDPPDADFVVENEVREDDHKDNDATPA